MHFRPHHPASYRSTYMINKVFHKESICVGIPLCRIHNYTHAYKLADKDHQVNCKKCLKKMYKDDELLKVLQNLQLEKCFKCGSFEFLISRDMTSKRSCKCGHSWACPKP